MTEYYLMLAVDLPLLVRQVMAETKSVEFIILTIVLYTLNYPINN